MSDQRARLACNRLDRERRRTVGTHATLKLFETAAGTGDTPLLTLDDSDHWTVYKERIEGEVADTLVAEIAHDASATSDEVMDRVDRLKVEDAEGLEDLAGLPMKADITSRPSDNRRIWTLKGSEIVAGAR